MNGGDGGHRCSGGLSSSSSPSSRSVGGRRRRREGIASGRSSAPRSCGTNQNRFPYSLLHQHLPPNLSSITHLKVSVLLITLSMIPLTDILFLHGPTAKLNLTLKLSAFIAFTAFASAVCLMFHTFKLMAIVKPEQFPPKSQLRASKILFSIAVGSLFLTCISITYSLLPKAYYLLPLALLPSLLVGGFHFLYGAETCLWSRCPSRGSSASSLPSTTRRPASAQHFPTPKSPFTSCSAEASPELWRCFCAGCCPAMAAVTVSRGHGKGRYLLPQTPP